MPTYEFTCPKCTTRFDLNRPMSKAGAPAKCPECRATATRVWGAAIVGVGSDFDFDEDMDMGEMDMGGMGGMPGMGGMGGMPGMPGMGHEHGHSHGHDLPMDDDFGF